LLREKLHAPVQYQASALLTKLGKTPHAQNMKEVGKRPTHTQKRKQNKTKKNLRLATPHLLRDKLHEIVTLITLYKDSEMIRSPE